MIFDSLSDFMAVEYEKDNNNTHTHAKRNIDILVVFTRDSMQ